VNFGQFEEVRFESAKYKTTEKDAKRLLQEEVKGLKFCTATGTLGALLLVDFLIYCSGGLKLFNLGVRCRRSLAVLAVPGIHILEQRDHQEKDNRCSPECFLGS